MGGTRAAPAAFSIPLDNHPQGKEDGEPILMLGKDGIIEMVEEYEREGAIRPNLVKIKEGEHMRDYQMQDEECRQVIEALLQLPGANPTLLCTFATRQQAEFFYTIDREEHSPLRIIRNRESVTRSEHIVTKATETYFPMVVPVALRPGTIELFHHMTLHMGTTKTVKSLQQNYFWKGMGKDVKLYIRSCVMCGRNKAYRGRAKVPIQEYGLGNRPFSRCHWDLAGPLPITKNGNRYILVYKDALTEWVEIFAIKDKKEWTVAEVFVEEIYCRYGAPQVLISDKGKEFTNRLISDIATIVKAKRISTTPYNPRSDGLVENHVGIVKDQIRTYCNENQDNWDEHLAYIAHAYRTTINTATGYTPYFLMFGREASVPGEEHLDRMLKGVKLTEYARSVAINLRNCWIRLAEARPPTEVTEGEN
jgi:hypothetical protein